MPACPGCTQQEQNREGKYWDAGPLTSRALAWPQIRDGDNSSSLEKPPTPKEARGRWAMGDGRWAMARVGWHRARQLAGGAKSVEFPTATAQGPMNPVHEDINYATEQSWYG